MTNEPPFLLLKLLKLTKTETSASFIFRSWSWRVHVRFWPSLLTSSLSPSHQLIQFIQVYWVKLEPSSTSHPPPLLSVARDIVGSHPIFKGQEHLVRVSRISSAPSLRDIQKDLRMGPNPVPICSNAREALRQTIQKGKLVAALARAPSR